MKKWRPLFFALLIGPIALPAMRAQAPLPPFDLALTINEGISKTVYRGWPLVLRGDAVLMEDVTTSFSLDLASLNLEINSAQGPAVTWPMRRITEFSAAPKLGLVDDSVRVVWVLAAELTAGLSPGTYRASLAWAGKKSAPVRFTVADAPAILLPDDEFRRVMLQSQATQYLGDTATAIAVLGPALAREPDSIELLVQKARVSVQRGENQEALQATQHALTVFNRDNPQSEHPPVSILEVQAKAMKALLTNVTPGPALPGLAGGASRTGASSSAKAPAASTPVSVAALVGQTPIAAAVLLPAVQSQTGKAAAGVVVLASELSDGNILADAAGQWAASATAGTKYGKTQYSPMQATGAPNVNTAGNSPDAWCPENKTGGTDWLEVTFATPVLAVEVRVRQNDSAGAIAKVEAIESSGMSHIWWEGIDPYRAPAVREIVWFAVRVPKTDYLVAKVKITLNLAATTGWKEIDAVQLVGVAP